MDIRLPEKIEYRAVEALIPYARNSRTHSDAQVAQLAGAIREFGWTVPILVDADNSIIAGHARVLAARKLGLAEVPCIVCAGLTQSQRRALVIADNKLALNAGWDVENLELEMRELLDANFDLSLTGFDDKELEALLAPPAGGGDADEDDVPEPTKDPVSRRGDVWILGAHRLTCGDSTSADDVARVLAGAKPHLMVTDPPYGVEYDPNWRNEAARHTPGMGNKQRYLGGTSTGKVLNDDKADWREAWALFPGDVAYVWHGGLHAHTVAGSLVDSGFGLRSQIIWAKQILVIGRGDYHWKHEPCWYAVRKGKTGHWNGDRKQSTVWDIQNKTGVAKGGPGDEMQTGHGTQKPVECMRRPMENNSTPGQAIYEPFSGSGTTIIAAEMSRRLCYAIELNPAYVDVAIRRWQGFAGGKATLEGDGRTFEEVAAADPRELPEAA